MKLDSDGHRVVGTYVYKVLCCCGRYSIREGDRVKNSALKTFGERHRSHDLEPPYLLRERT